MGGDEGTVPREVLTLPGPGCLRIMIMGTYEHSPSSAGQNVDSIVSGFERQGYIIDRSLATAVFLVIKLRKPILVEGHAGLGKTELAKALAALMGTRLIRLQCYEGLDVSSAVYEWNYQKQLLAIRIEEQSTQTVEEKERHIFSREFLLERPLLQSIQADDQSPVLLIDEIDRADEAFEAFLLELLSDFQITVPEMGTIRAKHVPFVVLTSNRSRELGDALKRRCLYQWIDYPSLEKEMKIVRTRLPAIEERLARQLVGYVHAVRELNLNKPPGVAETVDCAEALMTLGKKQLDEEAIRETMGCISKSVEDDAKIKSASMSTLLTQ
jgi:MoxR-like ATPase